MVTLGVQMVLELWFVEGNDFREKVSYRYGNDKADFQFDVVKRSSVLSNVRQFRLGSVVTECIYFSSCRNRVKWVPDKLESSNSKQKRVHSPDIEASQIVVNIDHSFFILFHVVVRLSISYRFRLHSPEISLSLAIRSMPIRPLHGTFLLHSRYNRRTHSLFKRSYYSDLVHIQGFHIPFTVFHHGLSKL